MTPARSYVLVLFVFDPTLPSDDRAERHARVLRELTEIGMDLAREVRRQALEAGTDIPAADLALEFSRIARAVRQTVALEAKLAEDRQARADKTEASRVLDARVRGIRRKTRVIGLVERVLESESDGERLLDDLAERLEDENDTDFADAPIGELVARICRDLGVTPDWTLWDDEPWAIEAATASSPAESSPDRPSRCPGLMVAAVPDAAEAAPPGSIRPPLSP